MTLRIPGFELWPQSPLACRPTAVALGIFDGVHLGHQALLRSLQTTARAQGLTSVVLTFEPHPAKILRPAYAPLLLEPIDERVRHMERLGLDAVVVHPFNRATAALLAEDFVRDVLHGILHAKAIFVGADFVFGHKQGGNVALLQAMGQALGFVVNPHAQVRVDGMVASSTKIREFVRRGALQGAEDLLGRPYRLMCHPAERSPSSTLPQGPWRPLTPEGEQMPAPGLYAAWAASEGRRVAALVRIAHLGNDDEGSVRVDAHSLSGDDLLPDVVRELALIARLHAMPLTASAALKAPSGQDFAVARRALQTAADTPDAGPI